MAVLMSIMFLAGLLKALIYFGPLATVLSSLFPTSIRSTGLGFSYNIGVMVFGGFTPWLVTAMIGWTGDPLSPSFYLRWSLRRAEPCVHRDLQQEQDGQVPLKGRVMIHTSTPGDGDFSGWLMYHSVGVFPGQKKAITDALASFTASWCAPDDQRWDIALNARSALLANWAMLIGANPADVFGAQNVTEAFARFIDGLDDKALRGRTVLAAADCFPSLHFLLAGLAERRGFALRTVPVRDGEAYVHDDDFIAAWTPDVALALVTWVSSLTSKRANLETLAAHAQKQASLIAVDLTQGMGILPFNVRTTAVDFACGSTLKWLCGAPGTGLGYVSPALMKRGMMPATRGWFSQENPFNWDIEGIFLRSRCPAFFDTGTPSVLPFIASKPGFDWMLAQPAGSVRVHNLNLCHQIIEMVDRAWDIACCHLATIKPVAGASWRNYPAMPMREQVIGMLASRRVRRRRPWPHAAYVAGCEYDVRWHRAPRTVPFAMISGYPARSNAPRKSGIACTLTGPPLRFPREPFRSAHAN